MSQRKIPASASTLWLKEFKRITTVRELDLHAPDGWTLIERLGLAPYLDALLSVRVDSNPDSKRELRDLIEKKLAATHAPYDRTRDGPSPTEETWHLRHILDLVERIPLSISQMVSDPADRRLRQKLKALQRFKRDAQRLLENNEDIRLLHCHAEAEARLLELDWLLPRLDAAIQKPKGDLEGYRGFGRANAILITKVALLLKLLGWPQGKKEPYVEVARIVEQLVENINADSEREIIKITPTAIRKMLEANNELASPPLPERKVLDAHPDRGITILVTSRIPRRPKNRA